MILFQTLPVYSVSFVTWLKNNCCFLCLCCFTENKRAQTSNSSDHFEIELKSLQPSSYFASIAQDQDLENNRLKSPTSNMSTPKKISPDAHQNPANPTDPELATNLLLSNTNILPIPSHTPSDFDNLQESEINTLKSPIKIEKNCSVS